jgi:hypothetical protein
VTRTVRAAPPTAAAVARTARALPPLRANPAVVGDDVAVTIAAGAAMMTTTGADALWDLLLISALLALVLAIARRGRGGADAARA